MFLTDQPIQSRKQDILGREKFAQSLAGALLSNKTNSAFVLGLFGKWGSGKTSLVNLTLEHVIDITQDSCERPIIIKFNPWNFSEQNQLIAKFFSTLSVTLKKKNNSKELIKIGEKFEEYSDIFEPLSIIPVVGQFTFFAKLIMRITGHSIKVRGESKESNLDQLRCELNNLLQQLDKKIIVIIDDIDRLTPIEIRQIFQLVKKIADFPNIIYLLSFDKKIILNALKDVHNGFENEYLEKIVQIPFEIPALSEEDIYSFLTHQINKILVDVPDKKYDKMYWSNIFNSGIKYYFNSLRDVSRFINTLSFSYSLVKENINPFDLIAITAIQVFHTPLYYAIRTNKSLFAGHKGTSLNSSSNTVDKEYYDKIIPDHRDIPRDKLMELLSVLFPKLESVFGHTFYGEEWTGEWRKKVRICSAEFFDVYFKFSFEGKELLPDEIEKVLSSAHDLENFKTILLQLNEENKIEKFLRRLEDYTSDEEIIPKDNIQNIVSVLMDIGDLFPTNKEKGLFELNTSMKILRIFYQLSRRYEGHDSRFALFKEAIENSKDSIYTIIHEVGIQDQQHGKFTDDNKLPLEKVTVKPEQLEILHKLALERIRDWKDKTEFIKHPYLGAILHRWREWAGIDEVKEYISTLISSDKKLINIVRAFLIRSVSYTSGDEGEKVNWKINILEVSEFIDPQTIEPRLRSIYNNEIENYTEKEKLAVKTFLDYYDGKETFDD